MGLKYYADMDDALVTDLLRQDSIKTENNLMDFLILVGNIFQKLVVVHEHTLSFIKVGQLTMTHIFQYQFLK